MIRAGKKNHTDPFLIKLEELKILYDFVLKYSDSCSLEIVNRSSDGKETRKFESFEELLELKHLITSKINKLSINGYKNQQEIISLKFNNPVKKILPFISPCTLKSHFSISGECEYENFIKEYSHIIENLVHNKRLAYTMLYSFLPSFFAALSTAFYVLPVAVLGNEKSTALLWLDSLFLFLIFSMLANLFFYPFLYIHNSLINFDFDLQYKNSFKIYFNAFFFYIKENAYFLLLLLIMGLSVFFYNIGFDLLLK